MQRIFIRFIIVLLISVGIIPYFNNVTATELHNKSSDNQYKYNHKILHINDIHGRFVEEKGRVIGMPKLKGLKNIEKPDLVLDSGDAFQGLPVSNSF